MSSRGGNEKKGHGHFHRGRGNTRSNSYNPPNSSKEDAKGNSRPPNNQKNHQQAGNKGNNPNRSSHSADRQQRSGPNPGGFTYQHNFSPPATQFSPQNVDFMYVPGNSPGANFGPQVHSNDPFHPRNNATRGKARHPPNVNQPSQASFNVAETPTELRVFTGSRESNTQRDNIRHAQNYRQGFPDSGQRDNFRQAQNNRLGFSANRQRDNLMQAQIDNRSRESNTQRDNIRQAQNCRQGFPDNRQRDNLMQAQIDSRHKFPDNRQFFHANRQISPNNRGNFHQSRGFHVRSGQNIQRFQTPSPIRYQNFQAYNSPQGQNPQQNFNPIFFKASAKGNQPKNFNDDKPTHVPPSKAPIFKFKKKPPQMKTAGSQSSLNSNPQTKIEKQGSHGILSKKSSQKPQRKRSKKPNVWKKKSKKAEAQPLFSFQRVSNVSESKSKDSTSEDEDGTTMSRCSSEESVWTTKISDDDDECSSDESEVVSEVASEISLSSSIRQSVIPESSKPAALYSPKVDGIISVFWDIENCPVPQKKSAVDFVKRIRTQFYEGRTEANFYVVCDVSNLSDILADELNQSDATVIHMSGKNKNAADSKISSLLLEFRDSYRGVNPAIVLISGDSDFSTTLNSLHYKFHVYINLVCRNNARHSLIEAAQRCIFYDDFIKELPSRAQSDSIEYIIIVSNYPENVIYKKIKTAISAQLKSVNCRVKKDNSSIIIVFPDQCAQDRALTLLKGFKIEGREVRTECLEIKKKIEANQMSNVKEKDCTKEKDNTKENKKENDVKERNPNIDYKVNKKSKDTEMKLSIKDDTNSKGATLWVCVNSHLGDINYWTDKLTKIWNTTDFTLKWEGSLDQGMFLASFKSLSQAQKAKKVLLKAQSTDPTIPKFLKLIKQDDISINLISFGKSIKDINKSKLKEHIQIIEHKKEVCLNKHKEFVKELNASPTPNVPGAAEAKAAKFNELNEQKVTFLNFTEKIIKNINEIDLEFEFFDDQLALYLRDYVRECNCLSTALPIYAKKNAILKKIKSHQVVIIRAETGSGKSTQLTQYIWREDLSQKGLVVCTQPRKIAAITLAKHVSSQVGYSLGEVVGYQVGLNAKRTENTAILYVTDFTMLKMIVDNDLTGISCIIIDEAHERTVYTDLLLGMIKRYLKLRPELKLIITSATIDTSVFKTFLNLNDDAILEVSGRTFPVEDVWMSKEVPIGWDYFSKVIDTAFDILNQEPGDILVFLTTPFETEKAVKAFTEKIGVQLAKSTRIYQLHGKLDVQEQQKVFERTPNGMRKVVFSTNCAETSVTIPGIRYVVDCGMVKESQYDAIRNMNVLSVGFVSQSSAEQRRGRAGRTQVGKCYRLYSRENYDAMEKTSVPEILRVNLGQALLRLMKLNVKDPLQFDFVQSPPRDLLNFTMNQLINLNAVNKEDLSLTELGKNMSCLPLEPRLSFLVLTGIELNLDYEAIVLAALVTISRNIFFRTSENRIEADTKKMRFCQSESDFLTFFEVYKEWASVPKQAKSKWCTLNCINARSLRTAQDLVNDLVLVLQREAQIKVTTKFRDEPVSDALLELVFRSFYQNICIFSGYHRLGYRSKEVSGDLLIHPTSSLYTYGSWRPQFLVYDTVLQTNHTYLINVSPVTEETIENCIDKYGLEIDLQALKSMQLVTYAISPIGKSIMLNDIIGKQGIKIKQLEIQLKTQIGTDQLGVEADVAKGEVKVHAPHSVYDEISSVLCSLIEKGQERLSEEDKEVFIYPELSAVLTSGIIIREVLIPGEFRDVKVSLKGDIEISKVVERLQSVGPVRTVREWKNYYKITFFSPLHAKLALDEFKSESEFTLQEIIKSNSQDGRFNQYKVFVSFMRRSCTGVAFITLDPPTSLNYSNCLLRLQGAAFNGQLLQCSVSRKTSDLRITNLSPDVESKEFEKFMQTKIPSECKITKCAVIREKDFESTPAQIGSIKQKIVQLFAEFTSIDNFRVDLRKTFSKAVKWNACVFFKNACDGEAAVTVIANRPSLSFTCLQLKPSLQTSLYCKQEVYLAIKSQIEEALKFFKDNSTPGKVLEINGYPKENRIIQIHISSNNVADMSIARKAILNLILGDKLECNPDAMKKLFSVLGQKHLKTLSRENCYIDVDNYKKVITIFGDVSSSNIVKREINAFLDEMETKQLEEIKLMPGNCRPGVLRQLLCKFGHSLDELKQACGLENIEINSYRHVLTVVGGVSAISKCHTIIEDLKNKLGENDDLENTETCPVCYDKVSDNYHRLEYCGHNYCKECILHWFQTSTDFPMKCISCEAPVVLADLQWATKEVKTLESEMLKKSLMAFVESREDVAYCPSPGCTMIFRISNNGVVFDCPLCTNSICTQCKELSHFGMSCSLYQCCKEDSDYSLKSWISENSEDRKLCPSCSAPIEKNGGCNHMTCWKCKSHMCWLCLKVFTTGDEVYDHQPLCPRRVIKA